MENNLNNITYKINEDIEPELIIDVYNSSGIKRPTTDLPRIKKMYQNSNLVVSAWQDDKLIGIGRALTDFSYCCYLSDLAVAKDCQSKGVGRTILDIIRKEAGPQCVFFLHAAPNAVDYYPKVGMKHWDDCFFIPRES